ncbi:hypothetical protein [Nostoc sp. T09]|nr:hypothetical protein [Nostoc sp. T09]
MVSKLLDRPQIDLFDRDRHNRLTRNEHGLPAQSSVLEDARLDAKFKHH